MTVDVRWREIQQGVQMRQATRDLPAESRADARDGAVGAMVEFASSAIATHSMNYRINQELGLKSWTAHARLRTEFQRTGRNDHGCLAVVVFAVTEMPFHPGSIGAIPAM